jgi:copper chaperone NosL
MKRIVFLVALLAACKSSDAARCAHCGMKIDPKSPFNAELDEGTKVEHFDTPRCALSEWLAHGKKGTVKVQDYYDRKLRSATEVHFVTGSDVVGPMGPALVPVDDARVAKFEKDHGGSHAYGLGDIDAKALQP